MQRCHLNQIPGMEKQYYDPFINYGKEAGNTLAPQFNQMSTNPADFYRRAAQTL